MLFGFLLIQFVVCEILIYKVIKAKRKTQTIFCRQSYNYDLTKFQKDSNDIAVVAAHGRLYNQSSV